MKSIMMTALMFVFAFSLALSAEDAATTDKDKRPTDTKGFTRSEEVNKGKQGALKKAENAEKREEKKERIRERKEERKEAKKDAKEDRKEARKEIRNEKRDMKQGKK